VVSSYSRIRRRKKTTTHEKLLPATRNDSAFLVKDNERI
jgi:hypothetical protein